MGQGADDSIQLMTVRSTKLRNRDGISEKTQSFNLALDKTQFANLNALSAQCHMNRWEHSLARRARDEGGSDVGVGGASVEQGVGRPALDFYRFDNPRHHWSPPPIVENIMI
jgi:hypothetical protein